MFIHGVIPSRIKIAATTHRRRRVCRRLLEGLAGLSKGPRECGIGRMKPDSGDPSRCNDRAHCEHHEPNKHEGDAKKGDPQQRRVAKEGGEAEAQEDY
jgi:hypothetical protein